MKTGRMTVEQMLSSLDFGPVRRGHAYDSTLVPTLAPKRRRTTTIPPAEGGKPTLPPPAQGERSSHHHEVKGPLAEGGMGLVNLAEQPALRRKVALKSLKDDFLDVGFAERMRREARILGLVEHPYIVPLYALDTDERNAPLMVMKRIEGVPWRDLIHDENHPSFPDDATDKLRWHLRVFMRVCDAVGYAHSKGVLHLDLKPDNVMIGSFREVYLVDWGVAVATAEEHRGWLPMADEIQEVLGTPAYIAPEMVAVGSREIGPATDVYLLGSTLHELLMGKPPHSGSTLQELFSAAYLSEAPLLEGIAPELAAIVRKALSPEPSDRHSSVEELRTAVRDFLEHRRSLALVEQAEDEVALLREQCQGLPGAEQSPAQGRISAANDDANIAVQRAFGRARFGLAEALRQWPENERATALYAEATSLMAGYHLRRGEVASAEILLAELDEAHAAPLREEAERQRREAARLEQLALQERDIGVKARGRFLAIAAFAVALPAFVIFGLNQAGLYRHHWWSGLGYDIALAGFFVIGGSFARRTTSRSKRLLFTIILIALLTVVVRVFGLALGLTTMRSSALELVYFASGCVVAGVLSDKRFYVAAPGLFAGALLVLTFPAWAPLWVALAALAGPLPLAILWWSARQ